MADCGDLRVRLAEFDKLYERHKCPECAGTGMVLKAQLNSTLFQVWFQSANVASVEPVKVNLFVKHVKARK